MGLVCFFPARPIGKLNPFKVIKAGHHTGLDLRQFRFASLNQILKQT